jgi:hypothetical protein
MSAGALPIAARLECWRRLWDILLMPVEADARPEDGDAAVDQTAAAEDKEARRARVEASTS